MITKNFNKEELQLISRAINCSGDGGHPFAEPSQKSIQYFKEDYIKKCLTRSLSKMTDEGRLIANKILQKQ